MTLPTLKQAIALNDRNYEAISLVLETYMSLITDTYGYAPILKLQRRKWYFET
jgi:hypothetical protein